MTLQTIRRERDHMKYYKSINIIGVDHGYGNIKTAGTCFQAGVMAYDKEPAFKSDLLVWNGRYYIIGAGQNERRGLLCADTGGSSQRT